MKWLKEQMNFLLGIFAIIGACFGAITYFHTNFASASDVQKLTVRVAINETKDTWEKVVDNKNFYQQQVRKYPDDEELKKKLEEAQKEVKKIEKKIDDLEKQKEGIQ